jgi:aromatic amino acid aminotransferase I
MNKVLEEWDEEKRGFRRPRVLYTVPTGQNPTGGFTASSCHRYLPDLVATGATMLAERKKIIYDICVKYGTYHFVPSSLHLTDIDPFQI